MQDNSATGTRTRVARVRAEYPNQLDYSGFENIATRKHHGRQQRASIAPVTTRKHHFGQQHESITLVSNTQASRLSTTRKHHARQQRLVDLSQLSPNTKSLRTFVYLNYELHFIFSKT